MRASVAARIVHDWALQEGAMSESSVAPQSAAAELALLSPVFEEGKNILRQKRVLSVGFNEHTSEVFVYTRLSAPTGKKAINALPSRVEDVKIRYRQGSHSSTGESPATPFGGPPYSIRQVAGSPTYTCGSSVSVGNCVDAGTLGALVRDGAGVMFGLSNNHVVASCSCAEVGLPIVAPGLADVVANGLHPFTVGVYARALPMVLGSPTVVNAANNTDAALFRVSREQDLSSFQGTAYDTPATTLPLAAGMQVEKVGRTTGLTRGYVLSQMFGPCDVGYVASRYGFTGRIYFEGVHAVHGTNELFSDSGDSGSLVTTMVNGVRHAVGLVFAGCNDSKAPGGKISYVLPLEPILQSLGVTLVSGHRV